MNLPRLNDRWVLILLTVIAPILLLGLAAVLRANICIVIILIVWIGVALTMIYLPRVPENL